MYCRTNSLSGWAKARRSRFALLFVVMVAFPSTSAVILKAPAMSMTMERLPVCSEDSSANATADRTTARLVGRVGMASKWINCEWGLF